MSEQGSDLETMAVAAAASLAAHDLDGFLAYIDRDSEFVPLLAAVDGGTYHGHDGVRRWLEGIEDAWASYRPTLRKVEAISEHVALVEFTIRLRGRNSAVELETEAFGVLERAPESGLIAYWRFFETEDEARAAALAPLRLAATGAAPPTGRDRRRSRSRLPRCSSMPCRRASAYVFRA